MSIATTNSRKVAGLTRSLEPGLSLCSLDLVPVAARLLSTPKPPIQCMINRWMDGRIDGRLHCLVSNKSEAALWTKLKFYPKKTNDVKYLYVFVLVVSS